MEGPYDLYQGTDKHGYMITLKTNEAHTQVFFRQEFPDFYKSRGWENPIERYYGDKLEKLRQNSEKVREQRGHGGSSNDT